MTKNRQFDGQFDDEEVFFIFRRHPVVMRRGFLIVAAGILIGAFVGMFMSRDAYTLGEFFTQFFGPVGIGFLIGMVGFMYSWIGWYYSICIVTDQRFVQITQKGIFRERSVSDIGLNRILSVNYEVRGVFETLLGFGTIIIQTLVGDLIIKNVPKPADTQAQVVTAMRESGVDIDDEEILSGEA